jgi:hypothetical protein
MVNCGAQSLWRISGPVVELGPASILGIRQRISEGGDGSRRTSGGFRLTQTALEPSMGALLEPDLTAAPPNRMGFLYLGIGERELLGMALVNTTILHATVLMHPHYYSAQSFFTLTVLSHFLLLQCSIIIHCYSTHHSSLL